MNKLIKFSLIAIVAIFVSACSAMREPIENPQGVVPEALTLSEIKQGISLALSNRGWVITSADQQVIKASLMVRSHVAEVEIPYSKESFQINYVASQNLKDDADGSIHNKYNHWVRKLRVYISRHLSKIAANKY